MGVEVGSMGSLGVEVGGSMGRRYRDIYCNYCLHFAKRNECHIRHLQIDDGSTQVEGV